MTLHLRTVYTGAEVHRVEVRFDHHRDSVAKQLRCIFMSDEVRNQRFPLLRKNVSLLLPVANTVNL